MMMNNKDEELLRQLCRGAAAKLTEKSVPNAGDRLCNALAFVLRKLADASEGEENKKKGGRR